MKTMVDPTPEDTRTPYERFNDLAKQVFTVPKKEIDRRQAEYEKQQAQRKQKKKGNTRSRGLK
jgi:hypothetical protein